MATAEKKKRVSYSLKQKIEIINAVDEAMQTNARNAKTLVARRYNLTPSTLSTFLKNREKLFKKHESQCFHSERKRMRTTPFPDVEEMLFRWFRQKIGQGLPISGPILQKQADNFARAAGYSEEEFKCSNGWLTRFKERHDIVFRSICGEEQAVQEGDMAPWLEQRLPEVMMDYAPADIYNADETGLFWRLLPDKTLAVKGERCSGGKKSKERITVLVAANMDGSDKLPLYIIGKFAKPRCFKNVRSLPVTYVANRKAWMDSGLFTSWVHKLDRRFESEGRKVCLIVDNCTAHPHISDLKAIKLVFLPPNTTSKLQPCDQGIIQNLKKFYRRRMLEKLLLAVNDDNNGDAEGPINTNSLITLLDAITMLRAAWNQVKPETVQKCFGHAGFVVSVLTFLFKIM